MPILAGRQRKQRTNAASVRSSLIYNAPGIYYPVFGRAKIYVSGRGTPGSNLVPGSTYTNPIIPGTYAGTNPTTPGNAQYNAITPGYTYTNKPTGGNYAGSNPPTLVTQNVYQTMNYSNGHPTAYSTYRYVVPTDFTPYTDYQPHTINYYNPAGGFVYTVTQFSDSPIPGSDYYNPKVPGKEVYVPHVPGNVMYNPITPGNPYTNPPTYVPSTTVPGNYVPGNYVPGNTPAPMPVVGTYTPAQYTPGTTVPGYYNPSITVEGTRVPGYTNAPAYVAGTEVKGGYQTMIAQGSNACPIGWTYEGFHEGNTNSTRGVFCSLTTAPYTNPPSVVPGNYVAPYTNPSTYEAGYLNPPSTTPSKYTPAVTNNPGWVTVPTNPGYTNPSVNNTTYQPAKIVPGTSGVNPAIPGTVVYNPSTPGNPYSNSPIPGNTVTVPAIPGQPGKPFVSLGVTFPGGPTSSPGPAVGDTLVEVVYTNAGVQVNVGPGGQVVIKEAFV